MRRPNQHPQLTVAAGSLADLLRQSVYSRLAGYEDLNDAVRVSADPTFHLIGSPKLWDRGAALTSTLHWFETELLTQAKNLVGLRAVNREVLAQAEMATRADRVVLDMDSSESPVHGAQEGSAYNGHFESVCYHPLFLFTEHGDCLGATLRPGNVHSADDWDNHLLLPEIDRQQAEGKRVAFRADAAFAKPEIYDALEQRDVDYAIRMPANKSLELEIEDILVSSTIMLSSATRASPLASKLPPLRSPRFLGKEGTMALVGKCAFVVGLVIAVAGGLGFEQAWVGWVLAVLGLIVGFLNINDKESQTFLLAAIALIVAASAVGAIPYIGEVVTRIIANLVLFLGGAVLVVAVKSLFAVARD